MKKYFLCISLLLFINMAVFSSEDIGETWFSIGVPFGNYFESNNGQDMYIGSLGFDLSMYNFLNNSNVGLYTNFVYYIPLIFEDGYNWISQVEFLAGVGFRHSLTESIKMHFGIGIDVHLSMLSKTEKANGEFSFSRNSIGIGGDIGVKYDINDKVYLNLGVILNFNIFCDGREDYSSDDWKTIIRNQDGWIENYTLFGVRPYIAVGFNFYGSGTHWGKPGK